VPLSVVQSRGSLRSISPDFCPPGSLLKGKLCPQMRPGASSHAPEAGNLDVRFREVGPKNCGLPFEPGQWRIWKRQGNKRRSHGPPGFEVIGPRKRFRELEPHVTHDRAIAALYAKGLACLRARVGFALAERCF